MPVPSLSTRLPLRVLVMEHDKPASREICRTLSSDSRLEVVGQPGVLQELPEVCHQLAVDVAVLGVARCGDEGCCDAVLDVIARTTILSSSAPVIALVERDMIEAAGVLMLAGARGVLARGVSANEFFAATCAVLDGGSAIDPFITRELFDRLAQTAPMHVFEIHQSSAKSLTATLPAPEELAMWRHLTGREGDVLRGIARGLSDKDIAASLEIGKGTVKMYVRRLFLKLGVHSRAAAPLVAAGKLELAARLDRADLGCRCRAQPLAGSPASN